MTGGRKKWSWTTATNTSNNKFICGLKPQIFKKLYETKQMEFVWGSWFNNCWEKSIIVCDISMSKQSSCECLENLPFFHGIVISILIIPHPVRSTSNGSTVIVTVDGVYEGCNWKVTLSTKDESDWSGSKEVTKIFHLWGLLTVSRRW